MDKYWPDDGQLRPKLVASIRIRITYYIVVSDGIYILVHQLFSSICEAIFDTRKRTSKYRELGVC